VMFFGTLTAVPWLIVRIPVDFFVRPQHLFVENLSQRHAVLRGILRVLKNVLGVTLVLAGIAMLVLPGQGILTILIGLAIVDFPGKFALEQRLARRPKVMGAMNWLREKAHRPPLEPPP
jgi:hypothetical protein